MKTKSNHPPKATRKARTGPKAAKPAAKAPPRAASAASDVRPDTKQAQLLALLRRDQGVSIAEAAQSLAWQPHSIRGVMSGVIKKKLKLNVETIKVDGGPNRYHLAA